MLHQVVLKVLCRVAESTDSTDVHLRVTLCVSVSFPIEEVTQMAIKAIKANFPDLDYIVAKTLEQQRIQKAEQGGADQPATAPESKSEGDQNRKPESEGRSQ